MANPCQFPGCRSYSAKGNFCVSHAKYFGGTTIKEEAPKPIPAKSLKRKEDEKEYRNKAKAFLKKHPKCSGKFSGCTGKSEQVHHKAGRSGGNYLNEKTWLAVCANCHATIEMNPVEAKQKGMSESRLIKTNS